MFQLTSKAKNVLRAALANQAVATEIEDAIETGQVALNGDIVMVITPVAANRDATTDAFTRTVDIAFQTADGRLHKWIDQTFSGALSIGDTSTAGTASIASTDLVVVDGKATVIVSGDAAAWVAAETNTLTIANVSLLNYTITGGTSIETIV